MGLDVTKLNLSQKNYFNIDGENKKPATNPYEITDTSVFAKMKIEAPKTENEQPKKTTIQEKIDKMSEAEKSWYAAYSHNTIPHDSAHELYCNMEDNNIPEKYKAQAEQMTAKSIMAKEASGVKLNEEDKKQIGEVVFSTLARMDARNVTSAQKTLYDDVYQKSYGILEKAYLETKEGKKDLESMPKFATRSAKYTALQNKMINSGKFDKAIEEAAKESMKALPAEQQEQIQKLLDTPEGKTTTFAEINRNVAVGTDYDKLLVTSADHTFKGEPDATERKIGKQFFFKTIAHKGLPPKDPEKAPDGGHGGGKGDTPGPGPGGCDPNGPGGNNNGGGESGGPGGGGNGGGAG